MSYHKINNTYYLQVKGYRTMSGLTQAELAVKAGVPVHVVSKAERGVSNVRVGDLRKIGQALGLKMNLYFEVK